MFKHFVKFFSTAALASTVLAQNIFIAHPKPNVDVPAGSNITVELDRPMTLSGSEEVAVVIGASACWSGVCPDVTVVLGEILYRGPYDPKIYDNSWNPYQNFSITISPTYNGTVQLGVAHFFLLGAGLNAQLQMTNTTINVIPSSSG